MPVQKKSLQLFDNKKKKRKFVSNAVARNQKATVIDDINLSVTRTRGLLLYGADGITDTDDILYGKKQNKQDAEEVAGSDNTDDKKNEIITEMYDDETKLAPMDDMIRNMMGYLTRGGSLFTDPYQDELDVNRPDPSNSSDSNPSEIQPTSVKTASRGAASWDPRLMRVDAFVNAAGGANATQIPFSSETAASAYYEQVFNIEVGAIEESGKGNADPYTTSSGFPARNQTISSGNPNKSDKTAPNYTQVDELRKYGDEYGTQSLMNPYCVTSLVGGLRQSSSNTSSDWDSHLYDIRDTKRFYDTGGETGKTLVADDSDFTTIGNPTTTNIIKWSNKDLWGRTPYSFQDFVFCKWWNIIPNNRLITFRKYAVPTFDNLNFHGMTDDNGNPNTNKATAPIATVVTYFGGDSANKLSDFLKFSTGTKWKDVVADVHKVSGDTGSNPRAVIDSMFENGSGFGGQGSGSRIVNAFLSKTGGITGQYLSFGKFVGLLSPDGYFGHSQAAWENMTKANVDPQDQIYSNRIIGPVNRIQSVKARDAGIEFSQSFTLVCEYVARPIGGINTKAAMLDIVANCLEIASPEASFWGGGYHFMIHPHMYPFKRDDMSGSIMDKLYEGKIFGMDGAIARGFKGLADFGKKDGSGEFSWSTVTSKLGEVLSQTVGAIGNMLQSVSSALFGESSSLTGWLKKGTDLLSSEDAQKAGMAKVDAMFGNLNKMWKDKVIQETTMPSISGMKAILTGEPTGNWHMTIGNPLNPIMVVGNLICTKMDIQFTEELGPDDFPLEMKVTYTIEHAMARDKQGIQSMFNRGSGKIYKLPDYIKAVSDYETKVDNYTGRTSAYVTPKWMSSSQLMSMTGARGWQTYKINPGTALQNAGNPATTFIPSFQPADPDMAYQTVMGEAAFLSDENMRSTFRANLYTRKRSNN